MSLSLKIHDVSVLYPGQQKGQPVRALSGVNLDIAAGDFVVALGASGCGKTTLLNLMAGFIQPSSGVITLGDYHGLVPARIHGAELRDQVTGPGAERGVVFQKHALLPWLNVIDNVAFGLKLRGIARAERYERAMHFLQLTGLAEFRDHATYQLSGGMQQRVGIARALVSRPEILLCDEATSALDPETTLSILNLLADINRRLGLTIVLITHEMSVIRQICDRVLVLERGRVAETGPVWQVFGAPLHPATQALLQPMQQGVPQDIADRLRPDRRGAGDEVVIELAFAGRTAPDLVVLAGVAGGRLRLLAASVDRIQGHTVGRLIVAAAPGARTASLSALADSSRVLGHVVAADD